MANKITQKEMFGFVISALEGAEVEVSKEEMVEFLKGRIEALNKKSTNKKQTATQVENEAIKAKIVEVLKGSEKGMTVTEILKADKAFVDFSNQKLSSLLRQLKEAEVVDKTMDKKRALFSLKEEA